MVDGWAHLAIMSGEVQVHAFPEAVLSQQRLIHPDDLCALLVHRLEEQVSARVHRSRGDRQRGNRVQYRYSYIHAWSGTGRDAQAWKVGSLQRVLAARLHTRSLTAV